MNADKAKQTAEAARERKKKKLPAKIGAMIQSRAERGRGFLLCYGNKQCAERLKSDGFRCILFLNIILIRW